MENAKLVIDVTGQEDLAELTATIIYSRREHFTWVCGDDDEATIPYDSGVKGIREFINRMKAVARRLNLSVVITRDLQQEMKVCAEEDAFQRAQQEGYVGCEPEQPMV
jgi:hypothetical protein